MFINSLSRRDFLRLSVAGAASAGTIIRHRFARAEQPFRPNVCSEKLLTENINTRRLDRFGGLESVRFDSTGFFRVEKADRWWFVTPDGAAFLSFGVNHTDTEYLLQDYNIDFWRAEFGFQNPSEPAFRKGFIKKVMKDLAAFGMNTIGTHARKEVFGKLTVPYIQGLFFVRTPYWIEPSAQNFSDVFSVDFEKRCERVARRLVLPKKDDPFLIGYTLTDCPILTDLDAAAHGQDPWGGPSPETPTWPRVLRNMGPNAPGKKVFVSLARKLYPAIQEFNHVYKTSFSSFDELLNSENWSPVVKTVGVGDAHDNRAFLMRILERYYTVACAAIRKFDANHLIFGDIINAQTPPPDEVVSLIAGFTDLIAYQYYGGYAEQSHILDRWSKLTGKPLFHADSCFSVPYKEMPTPIGAVCPDQEIRARRFLDFATRAFSRPDFIGWNWCGWVDAWAAWKKERQHSGLQNPFGRYHHPMPETMARFGARIYEYGQRGKAPDTKANQGIKQKKGDQENDQM